jgi:hypothetical protein
MPTGTLARRADRGPLSSGKPVSGPAKTGLSRQNRDFLRRAEEGLTARLNGDRRTGAGYRGGTMNHHETQGARGPLARIGRRVVAFVAACNYAQTRVTTLRNTPARF